MCASDAFSIEGYPNILVVVHRIRNIAATAVVPPRLALRTATAAAAAATAAAAAVVRVAVAYRLPQAVPRDRRRLSGYCNTAARRGLPLIQYCTRVELLQ